MCFGGGGSKSAQNAAAAQYNDQVQREERLREEQKYAENVRQGYVNDGSTFINTAFQQFDDGFFNQRAQNYTDYATPQLNNQYDKARRDLVYALADSGLTRSTAAATPLGELERRYGEQRLQIADQARNYADEARSGIARARDGLIGTLNQTADIGQTVQSTMQQIPVLSAVPAYNPLGQVFSDLGTTVGLARNAAYARQNAGGGGARLFSSSSGGGSGRVVG
jgi:hypothetical protein